MGGHHSCVLMMVELNAMLLVAVLVTVLQRLVYF